MTEAQIIEGCIRGDAAAQRELYERYAAAMMGVCCRYVHDRAVAEDLLHDGFITVFTRVASYRGEGSFEGWCRRVFVNTALGFLRRNDPVGLADPVDTAGLSDSRDADALERLSGDEVMSAIGRLPAGYRTILNLYAVEGYSHREIGQMLGISENTSRSQYFRARGRLTELLTEPDEHPDRRLRRKALAGGDCLVLSPEPAEAQQV